MIGYKMKSAAKSRQFKKAVRQVKKQIQQVQKGSDPNA
jgi:hypothetical protein